MLRLLSIQYLRALAAFSVVLYHSTTGSSWSSATGSGSAGVDLFFVISGFIMWFVTVRTPLTPGEFIYHRIARIAPIYWLFTILLAASALLFPTTFSRLRVTVVDLVLSLLFIPHYSPTDGRILPTLAPGWTLNYEMFFYALFALFLFLRPQRRFIALLCTLGLLSCIGLLYSGANALIVTYTNPILLEFAGGIVIGRLWELNGLPSRQSFAVAAILIGVLVFVIGSIWPIEDKYRIFMWGFPAFLLILGFLSIEVNGKIFNSAFLGLLGDSSYSLYLVHSFVIAAVMKIISLFHVETFNSLFLGSGIIMVNIALSTLAGVIVYLFVECKVTSKLRNLPHALVFQYR
jgi:exopolysaccharide production protein ExoZ